MERTKRTIIRITIVVHYRKRKKKPKGISQIAPQLALQVAQCSTLQELHTLFFSLGRKNKATMDAFIQKREELQFLHTKPNHSSLKPTLVWKS